MRKASTITAFCAGHDTSLFAPVENRPFEPSPEQVCLLAFRCLCYELFAKEVVLRDVPTMRLIDRGRPFKEQVRIQGLADALETGLEKGLADIRAEKEQYDEILRFGDFDRVGYLVIEFDTTPDVLCSGAILPECDFAGEPLQDLRDNELLRPVSFASIATERGGAFLLGWLDDAEAPLALARSLMAVGDDGYAHAVVRFLFEHSENIYMSPRWWDGLPAETQAALCSRFQHGVMSLRDPECLLDDGIRAVEWSSTATHDSFV